MKIIKMSPKFLTTFSLALLVSAGSFLPTVHAEDRAAGSVFVDCPECPEMVVIPTGEFVQGSDKVESGHLDEKPQHTVKIARPSLFQNTKLLLRNGMCVLRRVSVRELMMLALDAVNSPL